MNKKVLLVCYYFPPMGMGGVGRPLSLYRLLSRFGWDCHVLTVKDVAYRAFEPELLDGVESSGIYRSGSRDPQRIMRLFGVREVKAGTIEKGRKVSGRFFPDSQSGWVRPAIRLGRVLAENKRYDAVVSTSPPMSAHLVGMKLAQEFKLPWLADFRDYWTGYKVEDWFDSERMVTRGQQLLTDIRKKATAISAVNESVGDYVKADDIILNSFDERYAGMWTPSPDSHAFTIGLFGTFNELFPVEPLLKLLDRLRKDAPAAFEKVRLLQVGNVDRQWLGRQLEAYGLAERCECRGFHKRAEAVQLMSKASMLYIGVPSEKEKGFSSGRIYYLMASGRPILAAVPPDSEISRLVTQSQNGLCYGTNTIEPAAQYLKAAIERWTAGETTFDSLPEYSRLYSAETMVQQFAAVLDRIA